jgi:SGNH domain (fused to AT3 domains)
LILALLLWHVRVAPIARRCARVVFPLAIVALIACGTSLLDISPTTRGLVAALVATVVVGAGSVAASGVTVALLSWRPIRYLGAISYGTYLWHWPVVVLVLRVVSASPGALFLLSAGIGTAMAALSYELLEFPTRRSAFLGRVPRVAIAGGIAVACVSGLVVAPALLRSERIPAIASGSAESGGDLVPPIDWGSVDLSEPTRPTCEREDGADCIVVDGGDRTMLLIGDSHALMYLPAFEAIAKEQGLRLAVAFSPGCPWPRSSYAGELSRPGPRTCRDFRERTYESLIPLFDPEIIVAVGRANTVNRLAPLASTRPDLQGLDTPELYRRLAEDTVTEWVADGRTVVLIEPMAEFQEGEVNPAACLSGATHLSECTYHALLSEAEEATLRSLDQRFESVVSIDLDDLKCPDLVLCPPMIDGEIVNRDASHLSQPFVRSITPEIWSRISTALAE